MASYSRGGNGNGDSAEVEELFAPIQVVDDPMIGLFNANSDNNSNENAVDPLAVEKKIENDSFPEAKGIAFTQLYSEAGAVINITARANSCIQAIDDLAEAIRYAKTKYKLSVSHPVRPSLGSMIASEEGTPVGDASKQKTTESKEIRYVPVEEEYLDSIPLASKAVQPVSQGGRLDSSQQQRQSFVCVQIGVTPRADGKVKIDFYGNEYKKPVDSYPTLSYVGTPESAIELLSPVGQFDLSLFSKAAVYSTSFRVVWEHSSKVSSKGVPYKNIVAIEKME